MVGVWNHKILVSLLILSPSSKLFLAASFSLHRQALSKAVVVGARRSSSSSTRAMMPSSFGDFVSSTTTAAQGGSSSSSSSHIVVGNPAGDADSIVSALSLSYVDHLIDKKETKTPMVSVPRADLALRRETVLLLEMCRVPTSNLMYLDNVLSAKPSKVTLVDHNRLLYSELEGCPVVEILDHHLDEGYHDGVQGDLRNIAFHDSQATVASTCTLIAERLLASDATDKNVPTDLALALLGVILLDTVNMSPEAGKGTERDQQAMDALVSNADWSGTSEKAKEFMTADGPDTNKLFDFLSQSKFDSKFWESLSVRDALRLDYKQFTASDDSVFGAASVLLPLEAFVGKSNLEKEITEYMTNCNIPVLVVLSMVIVDDKPRRSIIVCGPKENQIVADMAEHLLGNSVLELSEDQCSSTETLTLRQFSQGNAKASRKQVVPIMMDYYSNK